MGMHQKAIAELERGAQISRETQVRVSAAVSRLGYVYGVAGQRKQAEAMLRELTNMSKTKYITPVSFANVYIGLRDKQRALSWLQRGYEDHSVEMMHLKVDPRFDSLRSDARFQEIVRAMKFPN
jgi:serine/threonine-protein kinase